ncbi:hypothetical protein L3Q82_026887 [Scortum barcoo]|uniref:Uncharacterized protein n=1 Tax=Scortum barcoo TaxID=214431 RepID=A0ACB8WK74_9TELE|nr:hypothetical protein L3Q82_026887 [Scortum barcoo]
MGDFQQFEQDFYQTGYYIDDQGHTVSYCDIYNSTSPSYYDDRAQGFMPGVLDPSLEQQYTGELYQPTMPSRTVGSTGTDSPEEEPPLLEGEKKLSLCPYRLYA